MSDPSSAPIPITLLVVPRFPLHGLALALDALRVANRESLSTRFHWQVASEGGSATLSSAGIEVAADIAIEDVSFAPVIVVLAAYEPEHAASPKLLTWLRRQHRRGAAIGCVDTGALLLAAGGLGDATPLCVHPLAREGARESHPSQTFSDRRYEFTPRRFSATGGVATLDLMLALIAHHADEALAERVARMFDHVATDAAGARVASVARAHSHPVLARAIELIDTHIEDPLSMEQLAHASGVEVWTLRRLFRRHLGVTPLTYYRERRLTHARQLLTYSHLSVAEVAAACGFGEVASFSRAFSARFGSAPSRAREDVAGLPA